MKIYTSNADEYVMVRMGICGEVEQEQLLARAPFSHGNTYKAMKRLKDSRALIKHNYDDGKKFLRLSSVNGAAYLNELSPALAANAKIIVSEDLKYSGSKAARMRDRINSELYSALLECGIAINNISCEHRQSELFKKTEDITEGESIFKEDGPPLSLEEIVNDIGARYTGLFTKKVIKEKSNGEITHKGSRTSRISGTLFLNGQVYQVYALLNPYSSAWKTEAEFNAANYITGTIQSKSQYHKAHGIRLDNKCILTFSCEEYAQRMIVQEGGESIQIDPCKIYSASYVIPSYDIGATRIKLLGTPNWESKLMEVLFPIVSYDGIADAVTEDGKEVYNFIACDLNKIRSSMPRVLNISEPVVLLVETWMAEAIHRAFDKDNIEIVEISESDLAILANSIA